MELESSEKDDEDAEEDDDLPIVDLTQSEAHPIAKGSGGIIPKTAVRKVDVPTSSQGHTKPYRLGLSNLSLVYKLHCLSLRGNFP